MSINPSSDIATVVKVIDHYNVVINRGSDHGLKKGAKFLIYRLDDTEIFDPETGESLGLLELVVGEGVATHVQPKLSTIQSSETSTQTRTISREPTRTHIDVLLGMARTEVVKEPEITKLPFESPLVGDKARRLY